ncbi:hypothetical protein H2198_001083 [Neophaeococcomyces mojaviensis]|uniref:Uncharacterized protein n=1 Tax=Neophaeococcomyces mojaviensis TaxID=3383035 RepID=A0ACC3AIF7_9EURO|nr:hypothetical protein H2198_001083 [Knufia sp. JES_112]
MSSDSQQRRNRHTIAPGQFRRRDLFYGCAKCPDFRIDRLMDTKATILRGQMTLHKHVREKHPEVEHWMILKTKKGCKEYRGPSVQTKSKRTKKKGEDEGEGQTASSGTKREQYQHQHQQEQVSKDGGMEAQEYAGHKISFAYEYWPSFLD